MRITERQLRKVIREVISEGHNQELMNEGLKDVTKEALLAAMLSLGVANAPGLATKVFDQLQSPDKIEASASHSYNGMQGEKLIDHVIANGMDKVIIPDSDLVDVSIALKDYDRPGHSSIGASRREKHNKAIGIIEQRLEQADQSIVGQDQMYSVGRKTR
jgi:hypothetical protein